MSDTISLSLLLSFAAGALVGGGAMVFLSRAKMTAQAHMLDSFKALAADTLNANSAAFLQLAEGRLEQKKQAADAVLSQKTQAIQDLVAPVRESLQKMDAQIQALEVKREGAYRELAEMVAASRETQMQLRAETSQLLQALRAPTGRGRWGELQLQRLLEMTGMSVHAQDFSTQTTLADEDGKIRPDMIVNLPGDRCVVIDSKVPLSAYLDAIQSSDDATRQNALKLHARQVKDHIRRLAAKAYWDKVGNTPEFVVLFIPGEHFLSAALDGDSELMEYSITQKIVLATPMTMVALLRTVAYGWRQEALRENVLKIAEIGNKLHGLLASFSENLGGIGKKLGAVVEAYNKTVSAFERKVLPEARRLGDCGTANIEHDIPMPLLIETQIRETAIANSDNTDRASA